jgi:hypothetical protein
LNRLPLYIEDAMEGLAVHRRIGNQRLDERVSQDAGSAGRGFAAWFVFLHGIDTAADLTEGLDGRNNGGAVEKIAECV